MRCYIGHGEAFFYAYRRGRPARRVAVRALDNCITRVADLRRVDFARAGVVPPPPGVSGSPYLHEPAAGRHHILVPGNVSRRTCANVVRHRLDSRIPADAFRLAGPGVLMSVPEFAFMQLAGELDMLPLLLVGFALCARYRIVAQRITQHNPISSVARIAAFLDRAAGCYAVNQARRALTFVADGAESPREVDMCLVCCLPPHMGGLGLPMPELNREMPVHPDDARTLDRPDRRSFRVDAWWESEHVGLEYLGRQHEQTVREDRERMNALTARGARILQADYETLRSPFAVERLGFQLAALLGREIGPKGTAEQLARDRLLAYLLGPERLTL